MIPEDDHEGDIGLFRMADSPPHKPVELQLKRTSVLSRSSRSHKRVPSSPLRRSNTMPKSRRRASQIGIPRAEGAELEPDKLRKMQRWIIGLATVNFDLDVGPVVDSVYPSFALSQSEAENLAFSSFPDSHQFDEGSQVHSFRIRDQSSSQADLPMSDDRPPSIDGFIYGFSHFTQQKDPSIKRGYRQRSIVILTYLPYPALFYCLISTLGPLHAAHGSAMLETACHNIANWPDPAPGSTVELGFLGTVFQVDLPMHLDDQQLMSSPAVKGANAPCHVMASASPDAPPIISLLEASIPHLWSIWECLVLCEPIIVFAPSPAMTSHVVWWLRDVLRPIPVAGDFRPYFTIHDQDHSVMVNKMPPKAGLLLGVTNPFIERACNHWPHILSLGSEPKDSRAAARRKQNTNATGPMPGWKTQTHNRYISKDRALLKQMEEACRMGDKQTKNEVSLLVRRHFCSRTTALLVPLNRYLNTLIPSPSEAATIKNHSTLRLKPFSVKDFLASLKAFGSPLPFRSTSKQKEFYERWVKTPAFGLWLAGQEEVVKKVLRDNAGKAS